MADPVTIGLGAMAVGGGISAFSGYGSDMAQAEASRKNAAFYRTQAGYAQLATDRQTEIFEHETTDLLARQASAYGRAGVDLSGSPMLLITQTKEQASEQLAAIREKGRQDKEVALFRALDADNQAQEIADGAFWKAAGSIFSTGGKVLSSVPSGSKGATGGASEWSDAGGGASTRGGNIPRVN